MAGGKTGYTEKRGAARSPFLLLQIKGKHYEKIFIAETRDVSRGGLSLASGQPLAVGDRFPVEFVLPDEVTTVRCTCEVVWTKELGSGGVHAPGVGVKFVDLGNAQKRLIGEWVTRSEEDRMAQTEGHRI